MLTRADLDALDALDLTRALTLWEPWASAVVAGPKDIENRTWAPPERFRERLIWIHSGSKFDLQRADQVFELWPEGRERFAADMGEELGLAMPARPVMRIVGCARIAGVIDDDDDNAAALLDDTHPDGDTTQWYMGPVGWVMTDRIALKTPGPVRRGLQGLWVLTDEERAHHLELLRETLAG